MATLPTEFENVTETFIWGRGPKVMSAVTPSVYLAKLHAIAVHVILIVELLAQQGPHHGPFMALTFELEVEGFCDISCQLLISNGITRGTGYLIPGYCHCTGLFGLLSGEVPGHPVPSKRSRTQAVLTAGGYQYCFPGTPAPGAPVLGCRR
eukprot:2287515-Rhodomonas_salina.1